MKTKIDLIIEEAEIAIKQSTDVDKLKNIYEQLKIAKTGLTKEDIYRVSLTQKTIIDLIQAYAFKEDVKKIDDILIYASVNNTSSISILSYVRNCLYDFFSQRDFKYLSTPDVDNEYFIFDALNIPVNHSSRSKEQTFYCKEFVLRPQTTSIRGFVDNNVSIFSIGTVYRRDSDARHLPAFTQIDMASRCDSLQQLFDIIEGCISYTANRLKTFFLSLGVKITEDTLSSRFRKHYFPFTCPSFEIDIKCMCNSGCSMCSHGWIEIAGCGIFVQKILPKYLANEMVMAFGMGIERLTSVLCYLFLKEEQSIRRFYL